MNGSSKYWQAIFCIRLRHSLALRNGITNVHKVPKPLVRKVKENALFARYSTERG